MQIPSKQEYLKILKKELKMYPNAEEILLEIDSHLTDVLAEIMANDEITEQEAMDELVKRVGTPAELADMYQEELGITPVKTQMTFIAVNLLFFAAGITVTAFYHLVPFSVSNQLWIFLTSIPTLIMVLYMVFWGLLGYEIGKEFGSQGKKLLFKTFYITLLPNLILMALVVFRIIPRGWFDPLLTQPFIIACIVCTVFLYPISYAGFRWGIIRSI